MSNAEGQEHGPGGQFIQINTHILSWLHASWRSVCHLHGQLRGDTGVDFHSCPIPLPWVKSCTVPSRPIVNQKKLKILSRSCVNYSYPVVLSFRMTHTPIPLSFWSSASFKKNKQTLCLPHELSDFYLLTYLRLEILILCRTNHMINPFLPQ